MVVSGNCILGHEAAGVILQVGSEVNNVKKGDRVAIEPGVPCGECFLCTNGRYNLCEDVHFASVYPYHSVSRTRLSLGRGALVCGAGPIGLIAIAAARASGAHPIVITDLEPKRLSFAKDFAPSCQTYLMDRSLDAQGNASRIRLLFGESEYEAPEVVLECTRVESSVITAAYTVEGR